VAKAIHVITEQSAKVKTLVDEVHLGSQEQTRGIEQIGKAIVQMEQVTQKAAASAEESASAGEQLNAQSAALKDLVGRLSKALGIESSVRNHKPTVTRKPAAAIPARSDMRSNLSALRSAVAPKPSARKEEPVLTSAGAANDVFPMDEDFKEF
jgi:methyl-accepting chemotaxis protein